MKATYVLYGAVVLTFTIIITLVILFSIPKGDTTLEFQVIDTVSKSWVWDFTATLDDRYIKGYYQSNKAPIIFQFTGLTPGQETLEIEAPHYESVSLSVQLKNGKNKIELPIEMTGYEIPGLKDVYVYKEWRNGDLFLNPRPIDAEGQGIETHPCIEMWFGLRISVQIKNGIIIQEPVEKGSQRGEELFRGQCEWEWDPDPDSFYHYFVKVPVNSIKKHNAPYRVYDYLVIFIDPRKITKEVLDSKIEKVFLISNETELKLFLDSFGDKITYFISTSWNQPAQ
ncbi:MAG: hypothetical protein JXJ04_03280 [Spirochaetales bacterium]|nr:hypothetical protein [Spirochaetales bacterium]